MLSITLEGLDRLEQAWRKAPAIVEQELQTFAHGAVMHLKAEVQDRTPATLGTLRASIHANAHAVPQGVLGKVGTAQPYAVPVELGTRPHMPPVQALEDWVQHKLGARGPEIRRIAWRVARKIAKLGTKGHFMFRDALADNRAEVQRQFDVTVARILARIGN